MSGERLIGSQREMTVTVNKVEQGYDNMSYHEKENIGFPVRYYDLSVDQKFFVDSVFETCYAIVTRSVEVEEELENLKDLVDEIQNSTNAIYNTIRGQ